MKDNNKDKKLNLLRNNKTTVSLNKQTSSFKVCKILKTNIQLKLKDKV